MKEKPIVLAILDGYGHNESIYGNAVYAAKTPNLDTYFAKYPTTYLEAGGVSVGLPKGQMGNSEVGHTNIGAGRIVYQELTRICKEIEQGDFYKNPCLISTMGEVKDQNTLHIMGLLSDGGVHSHIVHIISLVKMAANQGVKHIKLHCFLDGRDTAPASGVEYIKQLEDEIVAYPQAEIATVTGRYYAMDRNKRFERTKIAYDAIVFGKGKLSTDFKNDVENLYIVKTYDEFVMPLISKNYKGAQDGDSVIFANFRPDRARQISRAIADPEFSGFEVTDRPELRLTTMTMYDATMTFATVIYEPEQLKNTLGQIISDNGLTQLRIAETEKYAHVTFFFNGGSEKPLAGEERILVASPKVATYDLQPQMSCEELTSKLLTALAEKSFDVIILNCANCDMVGHTGNFEATVKAVEAVDRCMGSVCSAVLDMGGLVLITADHGNAEKMLDHDGSIITAHSLCPVPFCTVGSERPLAQCGILADVAPTILEFLNIAQPDEMTGKSILI